jgi:hypothetical protein
LLSSSLLIRARRLRRSSNAGDFPKYIARHAFVDHEWMLSRHAMAVRHEQLWMIERGALIEDTRVG